MEVLVSTKVVTKPRTGALGRLAKRFKKMSKPSCHGKVGLSSAMVVAETVATGEGMCDFTLKSIVHYVICSCCVSYFI